MGLLNMFQPQNQGPGGLLGMGGLGAFGASPMGNMGGVMDPRAMRQTMLKNALLAGGIGLMQTGKFGDAAAQGLMGAQSAREQYMNEARTAYELRRQQEEDAREAKRRAALDEFVQGYDGEDAALVGAFPEEYARQMLQQRFAVTEPKAPSMETLYDEKTGQPYKAQWDTATKSWKRIGGNKADENGITITNPDGTTTQIGGSGTKSTEADRRADLLTRQVIAQEPQLLADFDTLATVQNSVGGATGTLGRGLMTAEAQMAKDSLTNVLANWLYLTSGATMNQGEIDRQVGLMLPSPFDKPGTVAAKKARVQSIFDTMKQRSGMPVGGAEGWTVLPNGVKIRKKQ
jgi:hypothetical protein